MDREQTARLLTQASLVDNRRITEAHVEQWWRILGDFDFAECEAAVVEHFKTASTYLQPNHIFAIVKRHREERALENHSRQLEQAYGSNPDAVYPGPPSNMDELVEFYRRLSRTGEWTHGTDPDEHARRLGWEIPRATWD